MSVVLPVRDGAATIRDALESLWRQTWRCLEIIVVDDGSTDGTTRIVGDWQETDPRVRLVRQPALGLVAALQRGLREADGAYIARMDADDRCHPERLEAQLDFLRGHRELAGCGAGVRYVSQATVSDRAARYASWLNGMTRWETVSRDLFVECPLAHPTFLFHAQALDTVGGYRDRGWPEDYDLLLRLWRAGHRFACVPRVLLDWRDGPSRLSRTHPAYSLDAFRRCRVHHLRRSLLVGRPGVIIWGAGPTGKKLALEFLRQGVRVVAFVEVDHRKVGHVIHGAPVWDVDSVEDRAGALHIGAVARAQGRASVRAAAGNLDLVAMA